MRVLVCLDPVPLSDGTCANEAWIEQASIRDMLPTLEEANEVGAAFCFSLVAVAAAKQFFKPQKH